MCVVLQFMLCLWTLKEALQISHWHLGFIISQAEQLFLGLSNMLSNSLHKVNICLFHWSSVHRKAVIRLLTYTLHSWPAAFNGGIVNYWLSLADDQLVWFLQAENQNLSSQWTDIMSVNKHAYTCKILFLPSNYCTCSGCQMCAITCVMGMAQPILSKDRTQLQW